MVRAFVGDSTMTRVDMASFIWVATQKRVFNLQSVCQMSRLMGTFGYYFQTTLIFKLLPINRNGDELKDSYVGGRS